MRELWAGAILGAVLGSIVIPLVWWLMKRIGIWWREHKPTSKLFGGIVHQCEICRIFLRDHVRDPNDPLITGGPSSPIGHVPNVNRVWGDAGGRAVADVFNVLGRVGKTENIKIITTSQDIGEWDSHIFVIGAQSERALNFYEFMSNVVYRMDNENIFDTRIDEPIKREMEYGYGIILKASNPFGTNDGSDRKYIAFLIGGFGMLGTSAAAHYFKENFAQLGREFGTDCFGILVRASKEIGEQSVERVEGKSFR